MVNIYGEYFYGNKISDYGLEHGFVDYGTLAKAFDAVLNNNIMADTESAGLGYWEQESGFVDNSEKIDDIREQLAGLYERANFLEEYDQTETEEYRDLQTDISELEDNISDLEAEQDKQPEVFQFFIVSDSGAEILKEAGEIVFYNETLDMYIWGVTHWGTSWDYVLTDIPCNTGKF